MTPKPEAYGMLSIFFRCTPFKVRCFVVADDSDIMDTVDIMNMVNVIEVITIVTEDTKEKPPQ